MLGSEMGGEDGSIRWMSAHCLFVSVNFFKFGERCFPQLFPLELSFSLSALFESSLFLVGQASSY